MAHATADNNKFRAFGGTDKSMSQNRFNEYDQKGIARAYKELKDKGTNVTPIEKAQRDYIEEIMPAHLLGPIKMDETFNAELDRDPTLKAGLQANNPAAIARMSQAMDNKFPNGLTAAT